MRKVWVAIVVTVLMLLTLPLWAQEWGGGGGQGSGSCPGGMGDGKGCMMGPGMGQGMKGMMPGMMEGEKKSDDTMSEMESLLMPSKTYLKYKEELGLTDKQVEKLTNIQYDTAIQLIGMGSQIMMNGLEVKRMMEADKPDMGKVDKLVAETAKLAGDAASAGLHSIADSKKVLTADQLKKAEQLVAEEQKMKRMKCRCDKCGGMKGPDGMGMKHGGMGMGPGGMGMGTPPPPREPVEEK